MTPRGSAGERTRTPRSGGATRRERPSGRGRRRGATTKDEVGLRRSRRRRQRWLGRVVPLVVLALVLLLAAGAVWAVTASPLFALRHVEVVGAEHVSADAVRAAAEAPLGTPLPRLATAPITERAARPVEIASVEAQKRYPNTLVLHVRERTAVFALRSAGQSRLVDANGVDFLPAPDPLPDGLTVADVPAGGPRQLYADLAAVARELPEELRGGTLRADGRDAITLALTDGHKIVWGSAEQMPLKVEVALALRRANPDAGTYDVSSPSRPVVR